MDSSSRRDWAELSEAVLELIFRRVCTVSTTQADKSYDKIVHVPALPLVCSRWRTVYDTSIIWADIELDWGGRVHHATAICTWMLKRAPLLQQLTYTGCYMSAALDAHLVQLLKQAPRLVSITLLDVGQKIDAAVGHLRHATALRSLTIAPHTPQRGSSQPLCISAQALASLSSLPCLESIDIQFDRLWGNAGDLVAWSTLCTLTALKVDCRMESALMHPDALSVLSMLRSLTLSNVRVPQISPAMVSALSLVSRLDLSGILAAKPRRKSGFTLWHALRGLSSLQYLSIADVGQAAEMPWTAFACTGLRGLTLLSISRLGRWPDASCEGGLAQLRALEELHLEEVGLMELPGPVFWQHVPALTSLCWRAVRSCPQHQHPWRPGDPLLLPAAAAPVLSKLKTLRLEYDGAAGRFTGVEDSSMPGVALPAVIASCRALRYLSLEGQSHCQAVSVLDVRHLTALTRVSLDNCALTHVPLGVVEHPGLAELSLLNNPGLAVDEYVGARLGRIPQVCRNDPQALLEKAQRGLAAGSIGAE